MARYIDQIMQPGEKRLYSGRLHWILYLSGLLLLIATLVFLALASNSGEAGHSFGRVFWLGLAVLFFAGSGYYLFKAWFERWTTEIEVTDRRIVYKEGFIRRKTIEMQMDKVESVDVDQSFLGRILNYGLVTIHGTGEGWQPIENVAEPLELRNHITGVALPEKK
jgi:uncharacterized membrane protein YdbT with pleckstrin-like domain